MQEHETVLVQNTSSAEEYETEESTCQSLDTSLVASPMKRVGGKGQKKKHAEKENMVTFQAVVKSKVAQVALTVTKSFFPGHILEYSSDW